MNARRILVYGVCGSGKTTLARRISEKAGLKWYSVDDLTWLPNWTARPRDEQVQIFQEICAEESWILDTAYAQWIEIPLERVELIVALDYPHWVSFQRLLRRTTLRVFDRRTVCNGNVERVRNVFSRDSILLWNLKSFRRKRARIVEWAKSDPRVLRFTSPRAVEAWLETLTWVEDSAQPKSGFVTP